MLSSTSPLQLASRLPWPPTPTRLVATKCSSRSGAFARAHTRTTRAEAWAAAVVMVAQLGRAAEVSTKRAVAVVSSHVAEEATWVVGVAVVLLQPRKPNRTVLADLSIVHRQV